MKQTGVGPKILIPTLIYLIITIVIDQVYFPVFKFTLNSRLTLNIIGLVLLFVGLIILISSGMKLQKNFKLGKLMKDGFYKVFRNPMYCAYLIFVIPALSFLLNSWLVLTPMILDFILFKILIKKEYNYLEEKFGQEYKDYLDKVWIKFM